DLLPREGVFWNTLGVAHYRTGDWQAAVAALNKSMALRQGGDAFDRLFLAMAHQKLANPVAARKAYDESVQWLEENKALIEKDKWRAEELSRLRSEAAQVLELTKP